MRLTWLGHASVLLEAGGTRLLTDPALRTRIAHLRRQVPAPPHPGAVDGVLVSHVHHDHLDLPSLRALAGPQTTAVVPIGAEPMLVDLPFAAVRGLAAGGTAPVGGLDVEAVPAWHEARRWPRAPVIDSLGYLVERVWFAGDTDVHPDMAALRGRVDVALVPVWGWGPSLGPGHMDPERAAQALALVRPAVAVPIHWGTFLPYASRHREVLTEPPERFAGYAREVAPATRVEVLAPGSSLEL